MALLLAASLVATLAAATPQVAAANATAFQMTLGAANDFPGATGMAYRFAEPSPAGGWVVGGWAQHASAIARVAANGTVLWSHRVHFNFTADPWPCKDPPCGGQSAISDVAATPDGGAAFVGYAYNTNPGKDSCFVGVLEPDGDVVYTKDYFTDDPLKCILTGVVSNGDGTLLVIGQVAAAGPFAMQLDAKGQPKSAWVLGTDALEFKTVSGGDGLRLDDGSYVYSFNGYVPNMLDDEGDNETQQQQHHRQLQSDPVGFWGLMHLDSSGKPIASHHFVDTKWGHNCVVTAIPASAGGGFLLAGNLEAPTSAPKPYATSLLVIRVAADFATIVWSKELDGLPEYIDDDSSQSAVISADGKTVAVVGMSSGERALLVVLNGKDGSPLGGMQYGKPGTESRFGRVLATDDGGLLLVGDQHGVTYLVKTSSFLGESDCPSHQTALAKLPNVVDAALVAAPGAKLPAATKVALTATASRLVFDTWGHQGHVSCNLAE